MKLITNPVQSRSIPYRSSRGFFALLYQLDMGPHGIDPGRYCTLYLLTMYTIYPT